MSPQIFTIKTNKWIKSFFIFHNIPLHKSLYNLGPVTPTDSNCVCSKLLFWLKSNYVGTFQPSNIEKEWKWATKSHFKTEDFKRDRVNVKNCVCSIFYLKNNILEFFSTQIFAMKVDGSLKAIFYLRQYASLSKQANLKTEHTYLSKRCLLERAFYLKKKISEFLSPPIFTLKTNKWIKVFFYLAQHPSP